MERTEAPAIQRKLQATAIPRSYSHRAHLRLYRNWRNRRSIPPIVRYVPIDPYVSQVLATAPHSDQRERPIEKTLGAARRALY